MEQNRLLSKQWSIFYWERTYIIIYLQFNSKFSFVKIFDNFYFKFLL